MTNVNRKIWKDHYKPWLRVICDGTFWRLTLSFSDGSVRSISGDNDWPYFFSSNFCIDEIRKHCYCEKWDNASNRIVFEFYGELFRVHGKYAQKFGLLHKKLALLKQSQINNDQFEFDSIDTDFFTVADLKPYLLDLRGNGEKRFLWVSVYDSDKAVNYFFDVWDNMRYYGKLGRHERMVQYPKLFKK